MIGIGTALADDPALTVRLPGLDRKPLRVVLDTHLSLPLRVPPPRRRPRGMFATLVIAGEDAPKQAALRLADLGVTLSASVLTWTAGSISTRPCGRSACVE